MTVNWAHQTIWTGDNLPIMRGMNSESVDLIYLDPPFNSNRNYEAPIGSKAAGASFKDAWTLDDVDVYEHGELADRNPAAYSVIETARQSHGKSMQSYLIFMAVRLLEMHRILKNTGSIYLHCDPTASHYLKLLMDAVFGKSGFFNEIIWNYAKWSNSASQFQSNHDVILAYSGNGKAIFNVQYRVSDDKRKKLSIGYQINRVKGVRQLIVYDHSKAREVSNDRYDTVVDRTKANPGSPMPDVWPDINILNSQAKERTGYPTQKPLALLDRIIRASSNPGDRVFDPFCGCATSLVAADRLGREWAGIDLSPLAIKLVNERIASDRPGSLFGGAIALDEPPKRTDLGELPNYRTHRHRLYGEQEGICVGCDTHFPFKIMEVDHILPRSKGGTDHPDNLQLLCSACNRSKGGRTTAEWRVAQDRAKYGR